MAFENLSERLQKALKNLTGKGKFLKLILTMQVVKFDWLY
jgi:hypothetical protein